MTEILKQIVLWIVKFRVEIQSSQVFSCTFFLYHSRKICLYLIRSLKWQILFWMLEQICLWWQAFLNGVSAGSLMFSAASTYRELSNGIVSFLTHTFFEEGFEFGVFDNLKWETFWSCVWCIPVETQYLRD